MRCATHPEIETNLTCSKCGKPICPRCMVDTPVGARCWQCANLKRAPVYVLGLGHYLRAAGAAFGLALALGLVWGLIKMFLYLPYLNFFLALAVGYALGEGVSLSVNRKRGGWLVAMGGGAVVLSYLVAHLLVLQVVLNPYDILALIMGVFVVASRLR